MKALIVDDESYFLEYLAHAVEWSQLGFTDVIRTTNSAKAKEMLISNHFDLLITDIKMPEVSGIDLLKHVQVSGISTAVYFLSGYSEFEYAREAIRYGLTDYLLKPITPTKLQSMMREFVNRHSDLVIDEDIETQPDFDEKRRMIADIQTFVVQHFGEQLSLNQIAEKVYLTPAYLSTLYKNQTGDNLSSYITSVRMKKAANLLIDSQLRIADISRMVGYKKPQYFDQIFKLKYGQTPQQFRRSKIRLSD